MILSDGEIQDAIQKGEIIIDPVPTLGQYTTTALDLFLGDELKRFKTPEELLAEEPTGVERPLFVKLARVDFNALMRQYSLPCPKESDGSFILEPRKLFLGVTREYIELPLKSKIAARVEGRSTLARLGLVVHLTAPTIHTGFRGRIVLEMYNLGPYKLILEPGKLAVCQLIFERVGRDPLEDVRTKFVGQKGS